MGRKGMRSAGSHARKLTKVTLGAIAVVVLGAAVVEQGPQARALAAGGQTTITFVNTAGAVAFAKPLIQKAIADFEADNPSIKIQAIDVPFVKIETQLATMAAAGNLPDLTQVTNNEIPTLESRNQLEPLDSYDPQLLRTVIPASLKVGTVHGKLYGLPWLLGPSELFYNRDLMKQAGLDPASPPRTLDEFMADMVQAKNKIPNVVAFGIDTTIRTFGLDQNWVAMSAFGVKANAKGVPDANTPQMIAYLTWVKTLMDKKLALPAKRTGEYRAIAAQNNLLFAYDAPYFKNFVQAIDKSLTDTQFYQRWGVTSFPAGRDGRHYAIPDDDYVVMFKNSKQKDAVWKFMAYLAANDKAIQDYTIPAGGLPPVISAEKKYPTLDNPVVRATYAEIIPGYSVPPYYGAHYNEIATIIMTQVQRVFAAADSPSNIAGAMAAQLSKFSP